MNNLDIYLNFKDKYTDKVLQSASYAGIYVVFAYKKIENRDQWVLLDIGQANNIYIRHLFHERKSHWDEYAKNNECNLVIYTAEITNEHNYRDISEAALLYKFQPLIATQGKDGYHHGNVTIHVDGYLKNYFGTFDVINTDT